MYVCKQTGLTEYETFDELLDADIIEMTEYGENYYIRVKPQQFYDNTMWVVNKRTNEVSFILFTQYLRIKDKATPVNPDTLRKAG